MTLLRPITRVISSALMMLTTRLCALLHSLTLAATSAVPQPPGLNDDQVLLGPAEPSGYNTPEPYPNSTWGALKVLFKRTCNWDNGNYCDGAGALCCMNLEADFGFCCGGNDFGPCCGDSCCLKGYQCAYADRYALPSPLTFPLPLTMSEWHC